MHFFYFSSELIIALKVMINIANHFCSAEYGADCQINLSEIDQRLTSTMHLDKQLM